MYIYLKEVILLIMKNMVMSGGEAYFSCINSLHFLHMHSLTTQRKPYVHSKSIARVSFSQVSLHNRYKIFV